MSANLLELKDLVELPKWKPDPAMHGDGMYHSDQYQVGSTQVRVGEKVFEVPKRPYIWMVSPAGNITAMVVKSSRNYDSRKRKFGDDGNYGYVMKAKKEKAGFIAYDIDSSTTDEDKAALLAEINKRREKAWTRAEKTRRSFMTEQQKLAQHADMGINAVFEKLHDAVMKKAEESDE
jgi:hypothetical protein